MKLIDPTLSQFISTPKIVTFNPRVKIRTRKEHQKVNKYKQRYHHEPKPRHTINKTPYNYFKYIQANGVHSTSRSKHNITHILDAQSSALLKEIRPAKGFILLTLGYGFMGRVPNPF